jgi:serine O-acetyltransferase
VQFLVRLQRWSYFTAQRAAGRPIARAVELLIRLVWSAHIPPGAKIDETVQFGHNGLAVIVHPLCEIGPRCLIGPHVVLGGRAPLIGAPILESDVVVHAGAKIVGKIRIGAGSVIGANAVVTKDVPPRSLVVGVPGAVVKQNIRIEDYRSAAGA